MNQVPDCRQSCAVTLLRCVSFFARWCLMVKPSVAQNRLGGPPTEVPIPSNPTQSFATCCGTLFFKPVFKPILKSQALCECFWHTGNSTTSMQLKNKSIILYNCSFQTSRVSDQSWLHLCYDRLWFSGDVGIFSHLASTTTWKRVSELTGTQSFPTPSHYFLIGNTPLLPLCFSWYSLVRWRAMFVLDYAILGMRSLRSLRVFQLSFAHALTPWGEPRGRLPEAEHHCIGRHGRAATRWSRCCWGPAPPWRRRTKTVADPRAVAAMGTCRGGERMPFTCLQHLSKWILFLSLHDMMLLV